MCAGFELQIRVYVLTGDTGDDFFVATVLSQSFIEDLDLPPLGGDGRGGPLVTKTLLISALSAGGSEGGPRLIARNKATGEIVGSVDLPSGAIGTPMTYILDGRQYIGLTIGGPRLIAFALPE